jgi:hypothetical protein
MESLVRILPKHAKMNSVVAFQLPVNMKTMSHSSTSFLACRNTALVIKPIQESSIKTLS